jgi:hypothetical protein
MRKVGAYARWLLSLFASLVLVPVGLAIVVLMFVDDRHRAVAFWPAAAVGITVAVYGFVRASAWHRAYRRLGDLLTPATEAIVAGQLDLAEKLTIEALREADPQLISYVRASLAEVFWRKGAVDKAYAEALAVANHAGNDTVHELRTHGALTAAELRALSGDDKTAEILLDWAAPLVERTGLSRARLRVDLVRVRALLGARRGKLREAQAQLASIERAAEHELALPSLRAMWLLRAFVESGLASPRDGLGAERWVARLRAVGADDLPAYATGWPELRAFLDAQGLTAVPDFR